MSALLLYGLAYLRLKLDSSSKNASASSEAEATGSPRLPPVKSCGNVGESKSEAIVVTVLFPSEPLIQKTFFLFSSKKSSVSEVITVARGIVSPSRLTDGEAKITSS